jgi:serine/threonine-protein kinase
MIGTTIGKYRFVARLGRGGMGTVYKAVDETLDREVAIKVLNPEISDAKLMTRFRAEATTLARLNHPQIATIYEIYVSDADLLMVMELVRGETLDQLSARVGPLSPEQAAILVAQVLGALGHAHRAGIVHRDLKPANVMITEAGAVKIMDFGIARVLGAEHLTSDGTMMGTPAYMAPEQVLGKDIDARADLYAAGVVFYRLLTGCLPFQADTPIGIVQKQLWDAPTPARSYRADLPDWSETILERALAKAPADRFQTADEFRSALLSASGHSTRGLTTQFGGDTLAAFQAATLTPPAAPLTPVHELTPTQLAQAPTVTLQQPTPADSSKAGAVPTPALPVAAVAPPRTDAPVRASRRRAAVAATAVASLAAVAVVAVTLFDGGSEPSSATTASMASLGGGATAPPAETAPSAPVAAAVDPAPTVEPPAGGLPTGATTQGSGSSVAGAGAPGAASAAKRAATSSVAPARRVTTPEAEKAPVAAEPEPAPTPEPEPAAPDPAVAAAAAMPPVIFSAQTVVVEAGRNRQRDTIVRIEGGVVTVRGKDQSVVTAVPFTDVVGVSYSNSKQPLWNAPEGPTEIIHLDGGTFGFLRGNQHWVSLRTGGTSIVLRLRDQDSRRIVLAFEERLGKKVERVSERRAQ